MLLDQLLKDVQSFADDVVLAFDGKTTDKVQKRANGFLERVQAWSVVKILGVTIDNKLTFNTRVANVCRKAINIHKQLARAAKVSWGLNPEVTKVFYTAAVEPVILPAAGV